MNIEFVEEGHIYLKDGVILPSVSEILHFIFPNKYSGIPAKILQKKSKYGTTVHSSIELYENNLKTMTNDEAYLTSISALELDNTQQFALREYIRLKSKSNLEVKTQEQMICYKSCYAGRFDMIAKIDGALCLCDIKTTAELDLEYLSWQLSYYELAHKFMYTTGFDKLYAIWLPKREYGKLVEVTRKSTNELLEKLKEFKESIGG